MKSFSRCFFKTLMIFLISCFPCLLKAQTPEGNPIIDASNLYTAIHKKPAPDKQAILNIINANSSSGFKDYPTMMASIKNDKNNFLLNALDSITYSSADSIIKPTATVLLNNATSQGFPTAQQGVDALSTFIANRFKQEIEIAFLQKFKEKLDSVKELQNLMPATLVVLNQNDPYQYT